MLLTFTWLSMSVLFKGCTAKEQLEHYGCPGFGIDTIFIENPMSSFDGRMEQKNYRNHNRIYQDKKKMLFQNTNEYDKFKNEVESLIPY